jgi:hypothetical protein
MMVNSRRMRWAKHVEGMGEMNSCRVLVGKPEGTRQLGRPRIKWEDYMKMSLREVGCGHMDRIHLTHLARDQWWALVDTLMNPRVP